MDNISENNFSWGDVDFIEEGLCTSTEPLSFQNADEIIISEACGAKSPFKVLGVARGCFAPIGEFSRNHRLYDQDHWQYILNKPLIQERLESRDILGCLGHADKKVDDKDIAEGKVSHIVSKLEVREDLNNKPYLYGELEILDTPAGRILKGLYEGGANLFVSSRGAGKLLDVPGQDFKRVDKTNYYFENFDIVRAAGFPKAKPVFEQVTESADEESSNVKEPVSEENISEVSDYLVRKVSDKRKIRDKQADEKLDRAQAFANSKYIVGDSAERAKAYEKEAKAEKAETAEKKANNDKLVAQREARRASESDEISSLKAQVERLAKIVEKVVDDCYEEPVEEDATDKKLEDLENMSLAKKSEEKLDKAANKIVKESLDNFVQLMSETNISDEAMQDILDMIFNNGENK